MNKPIDLKKIEVSSLMRILNILTTQNKTLRMLERESHCTHCTIAVTINALEKYGLVTTERSGRVRNCRITEKGKDLMVQLRRLDEK